VGSEDAAKAPTPEAKPCAPESKEEPKGPPGYLPPWSPHLAEPPQKPPARPPVVARPKAISPPQIPPPIPSIHPLHWWFTGAPKDGSDADEYWVAPPGLDWKGYKAGQRFKAKGWKWLPNLGWTSADNWQFKHLKETPPGVYEQVALACACTVLFGLSLPCCV
jgi:hypothetical protein